MRDPSRSVNAALRQIDGFHGRIHEMSPRLRAPLGTEGKI
jgi:hypothetical protein